MTTSNDLTCRKLKLLTGTWALLSVQTLGAQIIPKALLTFPAQTESVEYDNLAALRALPNYQALKQRFSGKPLEQLKLSLSRLDVHESQVDEIVMGTSPGAFYGLIGGTFSRAAVVKEGIAPVPGEDGPVYCPEGNICVEFLEDSLAAFGTKSQLKNMREARQGTALRFTSKRGLVKLMNETDRRTPVRGVASGSQITSAISDAMQDQGGPNIDWSRFSSNISSFGYSVSLASKAHVDAKVECTSQTTAVLLRQMLGAIGSLQSVAEGGREGGSMPFQNLQVWSSGNVISLSLDTPLPTA